MVYPLWGPHLERLHLLARHLSHLLVVASLRGPARVGARQRACAQAVSCRNHLLKHLRRARELLLRLCPLDERTVAGDMELEPGQTFGFG